MTYSNQPSLDLNLRLVWPQLASTGCTRVAIHFDVETVDSNEIVDVRADS